MAGPGAGGGGLKTTLKGMAGPGLKTTLKGMAGPGGGGGRAED